MNWPNYIKAKFARGPRQKLLTGRKNATSRRDPMGEVGDRLIVGGRHWEIRTILRLTPDKIARQYYREEGYESPEGYLRDIVRYYEDLRFNERLFLHFLKEVHFKQTTIEEEN